MRIQHSDYFSVRTDHRRRLTRVDTGVEQNFQRVGSSEDRAFPDIIDHNPLRRFQSRSARSTAAIMNTRKKIKKRPLESTLRFDLEDIFSAIKYLNVSHVRVRDFNGHLQNWVKKILHASCSSMKKELGKRYDRALILLQSSTLGHIRNGRAVVVVLVQLRASGIPVSAFRGLHPRY